MEGPEPLEREVSADVAVEQKEGGGVAGADLVPEVVQPASRAKGGELLQVSGREYRPSDSSDTAGNTVIEGTLIGIIKLRRREYDPGSGTAAGRAQRGKRLHANTDLQIPP